MEMVRYFIEPGTKKYVKIYKFLSFGSNQSNKCGVKIIGWSYKNSTRCPINLDEKGSPHLFSENNISDKTETKACAWCEFKKCRKGSHSIRAKSISNYEIRQIMQNGTL